MPDPRPGLDPELVALREAVAATGAPAMVDLSPAEVRERVARGDRLCSAGPDDLEVHDAPVGPSDHPVPARHYRGSAGSERLLVYVHGGGWVTGDLDYADEVCRFLASRAGCTVVSLDYRLAPEHPLPAGLDDVTEALRWLLTEAGDQHVAVAGDSAGANLVAAAVQRLGGTASRHSPAFQVLTYPVLDHDPGRPSYAENAQSFPTGAADMAWFFDQYVRHGPVRERPEVSPLRLPDLRATPPTHLVVAAHDPVRDEALAYAERLRDSGVQVTGRLHPTLSHGFLRLTGACAAARSARDQLVADVARLFDGDPPDVHLPAPRTQNHDYDSAATVHGVAVIDDPEGEGP